jgi:hypothetical protein
MQGSTAHPLTHYYGWAVQNFVFLKFDPRTFFQRFSLN